MNRPPQKPSHLNSPVAHHRPESGEGPMRLWATVAAGALLVAALLLWAWIADSREDSATDPASHRLVHLI